MNINIKTEEQASPLSFPQLKSEQPSSEKPALNFLENIEKNNGLFGMNAHPIFGKNASVSLFGSKYEEKGIF